MRCCSVVNPMSDDFSDPTKRVIASRAGHVCSNRECRAPTSGPQSDPAKAVNLGVAAHITAASAGGPRYDPDLSPAERSAASNGVWLCQNCAKLIDNDVGKFSVELLRGWKAEAEAEAMVRVGKINAASGRGVFIDISVMNEDSSSWRRGEDTILRYTLDRNDERIKIESDLGYMAQFKRGGPIAPVEYVMSPTWCPFRWDFPTLDFKVLNNQQSPIFLTEITFDIEESRIDSTPLLTIRKDTQQRHAGELHLINEGGCTLADLKVSFHVLPGTIATPSPIVPPYPHSISLPVLEDHVELDVTGAFREEGVDVDGLILLSNGEWDRDEFVAPKADGSEERIPTSQLETRWEACLGRFRAEVGTLAGEISFSAGNDLSFASVVKFSAPVYLTNRNRIGIPRPPTYKYDLRFESQGSNYQKRAQISHSLDPGETDRFTIRIAVAQSSFHRFRATLRDVSGLTWSSLPIEMNCFVPRSRQKTVGKAISPTELPRNSSWPKESA